MVKLVDTFDQTALGLEIRWDMACEDESDREPAEAQTATPALRTLADVATPVTAGAGDNNAEIEFGNRGDDDLTLRGSGLAGLAALIFSPIRGLANFVGRRLMIRDDYHRLMSMSDQELADIGLSRGHLEGAVRHGRRDRQVGSD